MQASATASLPCWTGTFIYRHPATRTQDRGEPGLAQHKPLATDYAKTLGSTHDLTAARTHGVFTVANRAEPYLYADKGYVGGAGVTLLTPYKGRNLPDSYREANCCHAAVRANGERGFAVLKTWKVFGRFRGCPRQVGAFARAVLTLEH